MGQYPISRCTQKQDLCIILMLCTCIFPDPTCGYQTWSIAGDFGSFDTDIEYDCMWTITEQKHVPAIQVYIAKLNIGWTEGCDLYFLEVGLNKDFWERKCPLDRVNSIHNNSHFNLHLCSE